MVIHGSAILPTVAGMPAAAGQQVLPRTLRSIDRRAGRTAVADRRAGRTQADRRAKYAEESSEPRLAFGLDDFNEAVGDLVDGGNGSVQG